MSQSEMELVVSPSSETRIVYALEWLARHGNSRPVLIVGATMQGANDFVRRATSRGGAAFGWQRTTFLGWGAAVASVGLARDGKVPVGPLPLEALAARVIHELAAREMLGRFAKIADRPGLGRAFAASFAEVRLDGIAPGHLGDAEIAAVLTHFDKALEEARFADRARVFQYATEAAADRAFVHPYLGMHVLMLDVPIRFAREAEFAKYALGRAPGGLLTLAEGDEVTLRRTGVALGDRATISRVRAPEASRTSFVQEALFSDRSAAISSSNVAGAFEYFSAPGESRECVEIARKVAKAASDGTPFDRMAILLRSPGQYRAHLLEALRRAKIPWQFSRGTVLPNPAGRAFAALLACRAENYSAHRFAEYLSLGEARAMTTSASVRREEDLPWIPPDDDLLPPSFHAAADEVALENENAEKGEAYVASRGWEALLVDAAVIGGKDRWERRLLGLRRELELDRLEMARKGEDVERLDRRIGDLDALTQFALPLVRELERFPELATWDEWLDLLHGLAARALRTSAQVRTILSELAPMGPVGPVDLSEIRVVLEPRLTGLCARPSSRRYGRVFIGTPDEVRGMSFELVFVPGLAERMFPQRIIEDPILPDLQRQPLAMRTNDVRSQEERLSLRLAFGAATDRIVLSYPRMDVERARERTPSSYALAAIQAAEGDLPSLEELGRRAAGVAHARLGWPAPERPLDAIDEAEHDLALLHKIFRSKDGTSTDGMAHYLLSANAHLARALRFRNERWFKSWTRADGLVDPRPEAQPALSVHQLSTRSFSPTALQNFAACPYKFFLYALLKLQPRQEPIAIEEMDPLQKGSFVHEIQYCFLRRLRELGLLPVTTACYEQARLLLDEVIQAVALRYHDELAPAIERVWQDGIDSITADLRELLRRAVEEIEWVPAYFELSFGLAERRDQDPSSVEAAVEVGSGLRVRGSIDLVERRADGALRATDYKTGKVRAKAGTIIDGGKSLQPALYSLVLESLFPKMQVVGGRLYYCTSTGDFTVRDVSLGDALRESIRDFVGVVDQSLRQGFLPAAPEKDGCRYCDYQPICGPYEEERTRRKKGERLLPLETLRRRA